MTDPKKRRECIKYGSCMSGSQRLREFCFDMGQKKYRYFKSKEEQKDVETKTMVLARCEYEVQNKVNIKDINIIEQSWHLWKMGRTYWQMQ